MTSKGSSDKKVFRKFIWLGIADGLAIMIIIGLGLFAATHVALGWGWLPMAIAVFIALGVHEAFEHWEDLVINKKHSAEHSDKT